MSETSLSADHHAGDGRAHPDAGSFDGALSALDLASYLCSKVCHDVISPVGAIANGLEVLDGEDDAQMREFAMDLIHKSAEQASAKLKFARLAFGASGSAGSLIDLRDAQEAARGVLAGEKLHLDWEPSAERLPKNAVKLLLNLVMLSTNCIPRGGDVKVTIEMDGPRFTVIAAGTNARVPEDISAAFGSGMTEVTAHNVQPYFARTLADDEGMTLAIDHQGDAVRFQAGPA